MSKKKSHRPTYNGVERRAAINLDEAARIQAFRENLSDSIKRDLEAGLSAEEMMAKHESLAVARLITILQTEADSAKALPAARELLDRVQGKPTQRQEVKHQYEKLADEELDSLLSTMIEDTKD